MFNTLRYARMLEEVGFSRDQSETSIKILVEIMDDKFATKEDIRALEAKLVSGFERAATQTDFKISQLESKLTMRMGAMFAATIAILTAIQKLT